MYRAPKIPMVIRSLGLMRRVKRGWSWVSVVIAVPYREGMSCQPRARRRSCQKRA